MTYFVLIYPSIKHPKQIEYIKCVIWIIFKPVTIIKTPQVIAVINFIENTQMQQEIIQPFSCSIPRIPIFLPNDHSAGIKVSSPHTKDIRLRLEEL